MIIQTDSNDFDQTKGRQLSKKIPLFLFVYSSNDFVSIFIYQIGD